MTNEHDDILREIEEALSIDPSPEFAARVRAATQAERGRRETWMLGVRWAAVAAVIAAAVIASMWRALPTQGVEREASAERSLSDVRSPASDVPLIRPDVRASSASEGRRREAGILVPRDQADGVARLLANIREGHDPAPPTELPETLHVEEIPPIAPIEVAPIVVPLIPAG